MILYYVRTDAGEFGFFDCLTEARAVAAVHGGVVERLIVT